MPEKKYHTLGEALCRRELRKEKRAGVDHFVTGQYGAFVENDIAYVTFVDVMGHAVNIPFERDGEGWKAVGVYQRAGQATAEPLEALPGDFVPPTAVREQLEAL